MLQQVQRDAVCADVSVPEVSVQRMKLDERRIDSLIEGIKQVANTEDPIGKTLCRTEIAQVLRSSSRVESLLASYESVYAYSQMVLCHLKLHLIINYSATRDQTKIFYISTQGKLERW